MGQTQPSSFTRPVRVATEQGDLPLAVPIPTDTRPRQPVRLEDDGTMTPLDEHGEPVVRPVEEAAPAAETPVEAPAPTPSLLEDIEGDEVMIVYRGQASVAKIDDLRIEPGVPTKVSKAIAEALLTHPNEEFEVYAVAADPEAPPDEE